MASTTLPRMPPELRIAEAAAQAGAEIALRHFHDLANVTSQVKPGEQSFNRVSIADIESEHAIVGVIRREFPNHAILGEEAHTAAADAEHLWVIDPIDGTNNFLHGIPQFGISVAYYRAGQPLCGVILNPARGDRFVAASGQGAFHNGQRVCVSKHQRLDEVLIGLGFYYDRGAMMEATLSAMRELFSHNIHCIRRLGAATLDLCMVACGQLGAYFEYELSPWDFAAGRIFVEEAGGRVTTCNGGPLPLAKTHILATNGPLHDIMLDIVKHHLPSPNAVTS
jgi:myo-inositol-1(or 4)-monophosphatase